MNFRQSMNKEHVWEKMKPRGLLLGTETKTQERKAMGWHEYLRWHIMATRFACGRESGTLAMKTGLPLTISHLLLLKEMSALLLSLHL